VHFWIDLNQECIENTQKIQFFPVKVLAVREKVVPLHPLNEQQGSRGTKERVL